MPRVTKPKNQSLNPSSAAIQATSQQTRFALSLDDTNSIDTDIPGVHLSIGDRELLSDAHLKLKTGVHYVVIGRNGVGKSTLLRAVRDKLIPGLAENLRILMLDQSYNSDAGGEGWIGDENPVEFVVRSDKDRTEALRRQQILQSALDKSESDPTAIVHAVQSLEHEDRLKQLEIAKKTAQLRSGARGIKARKELKALEDEMASLSIQQHDSSSEASPELITTCTTTALSMLTTLQSTVLATESEGGTPPETHALSILRGLGFVSKSKALLSQPVRALSSGWQMRVRLASLLYQLSLGRCDLFLLDEPTNFLDLPAMIWLEDFLCFGMRGRQPDQEMTQTGAPGEKTIVMFVSHDRAFAEAVGEEVIVLKPSATEASAGGGAQLVNYPSTLSSFTHSLLSQHLHTSRLQASLERHKTHISQSIQHSLQAAARSGDDKKLKQAKSRQRKLDDRMGMEMNKKGGRFKLNRDLAGWHTKSREDVVVSEKSVLGGNGKAREGRIVLPSDENLLVELRFPGALVDLDAISVWYTKKKGTGTPTYTLRNAGLTIRLGERIGIVGLNGAGKSTLVRCLMTDEQAREVGLDSASAKTIDGVTDEEGGKMMISGSIKHHPRAKIGYFSQVIVESLDLLPPGMTALAWMMRGGFKVLLAGGDVDDIVSTEHLARSSLACLGLVGRTVTHVPIRQLSGGQKVRLALTGIIYPPPLDHTSPNPVPGPPPHLLILDEPTTHLDSESVCKLANQLRKYPGAVVVVSHDRWFLRAVVQGDREALRLASFDGSDEDGEGSDEDEYDDDDESHGTGVQGGAGTKGGLGTKGRVYLVNKAKVEELEGGVEEFEEKVRKGVIK